jgi:type IV pilus assembly protein PilE
MVVLAIIGILASIVYPSYLNYMYKAGRSDGITALLGLQQAQEKLRANCRFYAENLGNADNCGNTAAASTIDYNNTSKDGNYNLSITSASGNSFIAKATATGGQAKDSDCKVLILTVNAANPDGLRSSQNAGGSSSSGCW